MANHKIIQIQFLKNLKFASFETWTSLKHYPIKHYFFKKDRKKEGRHLPLVSSANRGYTVSPHDLKAQPKDFLSVMFWEGMDGMEG